MAPNIIGITGKAGHGKDLLYQRVLAPRGYVRVAFADPLKALLFAGVYDPEQLLALGNLYYMIFGEEKPPAIREALQKLGTDKIRTTVDPGIWAYFGLQQVWRLASQGRKVAVTDVRFENEARALLGDIDWLKDQYAQMAESGGIFSPRIREGLTSTWSEGGLIPPPGEAVLVRVSRPAMPEPDDEHVSELGGFTVSRWIEAATPDELSAQAETWLGSLEAATGAALTG